uniref:hematopoietic SH2 domain-containing protein n=1 Tax=Jaculus jaculus TaxID=51337 RepID=UPI001E1AFBCC|nr:hematopoietic SH2 domain-containing protein [Jaculus jaculus]
MGDGRRSAPESPSSEAADVICPEYPKPYNYQEKLGVKLLDDGNFQSPGDNIGHASLGALVTFHQEKPLGRHGELLIQPPGQVRWAVPVSVLAGKGRILRSHCTREGRTRSHAGRPTATSCPHKVLFGDTCQRLWKSLRMLPQEGRKVQQQSMTREDSQEHSRDSNDPHVVPSPQNPSDPQAHKDKDASSKKTFMSTSWSEAATSVGAWHLKVVRSLSTQASKPEPMDSAKAQDWLPEEHFPPPPFAPGYC